jgi:predicted nucleic acid-binding protein
MIFVDTGAWYAAAVPDDPDHAAAAAFLSSNRELLATSE